MTSAWKQLRRRYFKPWWHVRYAGIRVHYKRHLDGGGTAHGQEFLPFLADRGMPRQPRVFEWCAGPGFIGFSMLAHGFCDTLCLADVNEEAVRACRRTMRDNGLEDRVSVYHSDNLRAIPASEQWDLVVSNPPHFHADEVLELRLDDRDWDLHRTFFASVGRFLKPGGVIVLQENNLGSTAAGFRAMIEEAGLSIAFVHGCAGQRTLYPRFYYIGIVRRGDAAPVWAIGSA
jgi:methylase of polypeptide subunit release factors